MRSFVANPRNARQATTGDHARHVRFRRGFTHRGETGQFGHFRMTCKMKASSVAAATILTVASLATMRANAVEKSRFQWDQGGPACQLSVPTTSSKVRPRATGMRNEGTTNEFVICQYASTSSSFTSADIYFQTIDGANHAMQCTGMRGTSAGGDAYYSTKNGDTGTGGYSQFSWTPSDFGQTTDFGNAMFSVTCILPAGSSIIATEAIYTEDVGS